jgi:molecular chaperone DnaK
MTRVPKVQALVKEIFGKEGHKGVNPDEVVALGAAIQGAQLLLGSQSNVVLLDVTPLSLGIETLGGVMTKLIERNTTIPKKATETFSTAEDNQTTVTVQVYQGERPLTRDNRLLDKFNLENIQAAPRGMPKVEVTFDIDANGILNVSAKDVATGKEQRIRIESTSGLTPQEIERMRKDAEAHAEEDRRKRELIDTRNRADQLRYEVEKVLKDNADKLSDGDKQPIQAALDNLKQVAEREDVNAIKQAITELEHSAKALAQHVQRGGAQPGAQPSGDGKQAGTGKDDVIDAEFEVKK